MVSPLLSNMKILDFTALLPGPYATMVLADLGAEALRIESSKCFDPMRVMPPFIDEKGSLSCGHAYLNRNKKTIALDPNLKHIITETRRWENEEPHY
ncbi:MAG: CoA transferase [Thermodesulfobacteriota bacterium]|nr:CoA transferase [Thermodesulfobacteriota bacterium]